SFDLGCSNLAVTKVSNVETLTTRRQTPLPRVIWRSIGSRLRPPQTRGNRRGAPRVSRRLRRRAMFVSETTYVLTHLRMCLCIWRIDSILYAFERILFGANVAKVFVIAKRRRLYEL